MFLLKNSKFFYEFFCKILFKNMNSTYEFTLKEGPRRWKIFKGLKV